MESLYHVFMSITQSLRCKTGKDFENCLETILIDEGFREGIHYDKQVYVTEKNHIISKTKPRQKSHTVDFIIPPPSKYPINSKEYKGEIVTCKSSFRERGLQDIFIASDCQLTFISLESTKYENCKTIQVGKDLTKWIEFQKEKMNI